MRWVLLRVVTALLVALPMSACREVGTSTPAATRLGVGNSPDLGRYLTDDNGRALYVRVEDGKGESGCYDTCAEAWTPAPGATPPPESAEPAVQQELVNAIRRRDGTLQATYSGHPLYLSRSTSATDQPQQTIRDAYGTWSLLFPHGELMMPPSL